MAPDGFIMFLGRNDTQVKIRGHRIEPGEIEECLKAFEEVENAVVIADIFNENKETGIATYITVKSTLDEEELKFYINKKLSSYMFPTYFTVIDEIPLTVNGKTDVKNCHTRS